MSKLLLLAALALPVTAGADMTPAQQRAVTGAAVGAGIGAIGGNAGLGAAAGAGAGLLGGLRFDQSRPVQDRDGFRGRTTASVNDWLPAAGPYFTDSGRDRVESAAASVQGG